MRIMGIPGCQGLDDSTATVVGSYLSNNPNALISKDLGHYLISHGFLEFQYRIEIFKKGNTDYRVSLSGLRK